MIRWSEESDGYRVRILPFEEAAWMLIAGIACASVMGYWSTRVRGHGQAVILVVAGVAALALLGSFLVCILRARWILVRLDGERVSWGDPSGRSDAQAVAYFDGAGSVFRVYSYERFHLVAVTAEGIRIFLFPEWKLANPRTLAPLVRGLNELLPQNSDRPPLQLDELISNEASAMSTRLIIAVVLLLTLVSSLICAGAILW